MRGLLHLGVSAGLLLSFARAPFHHAHASDPHHEHAEGFAHAHWHHHPHEDGRWKAEDRDSDARLIDWLAGDGAATARFVVALPESVAQAVLATPIARIAEFTPHNHGPPGVPAFSPRGPPA